MEIGISTRAVVVSSNAWIPSWFKVPWNQVLLRKQYEHVAKPWEMRLENHRLKPMARMRRTIFRILLLALVCRSWSTETLQHTVPREGITVHFRRVQLATSFLALTSIGQVWVNLSNPFWRFPSRIYAVPPVHFLPFDGTLITAFRMYSQTMNQQQFLPGVQ